MPTLVEFLEELADTGSTIQISPVELARLVDRFGERVRQMGRWNTAGDGSLEVPVVVIREAASQIGSLVLGDAVHQLKAAEFTQILESSAAVALIDAICAAYRRRFREMMTRYQETSDPGEAARLRDELVREVFGG